MSFRTIFAAASFAAALGVAGVAQAGAADYAFEPVQAEVEKGDGVVVAVRLVDKATKAYQLRPVMSGSAVKLPEFQKTGVSGIRT